MNIASDIRERVGTNSMSESFHNTYRFSQESGQSVSSVNVETVKDGNRVCSASLDVSVNRLIISITDYKYLTLEERISALTTMITDMDKIVNEEV